ncbi:MAG TPA: IPTL-CTERM sorting domain-containing protein [Xanthomonadales bacterium]|nr:IPTL-CTERM sorting domain-containing protein [Xanthomonadales bacterium]
MYLYGVGDTIFTPEVIPEYPFSNCWVVETVYDSGVEVDNDCGFDSLQISAGVGGSCLITNTVFFEGIPTLSQYGMAILALLMLGLGFVGFRRFV